MTIIEAASREEMAVRVESLRAISIEEQALAAEKKSLISILENFEGEVYNNCDATLLAKSGICYRQYVFDRSIKTCVKYLRCKGNKVTFLPGEIELEAARAQLKNKRMTDDRYKYNVDGMIYADDFSHLELLLIKVSSEYVSNDTGKVSFDHYKAMFGMLAIIRNIA
ncbi:uncharacterized protein RHIMIDRAFT_245995 [Rhizopus microsporus ATCC 52813]|uniref:Uncharacterized protein n=2 Tax=Rhizopus microsporus TaxID=58291 RepID=A0A2G4SM22_RHIZD|nr:uncharacterized protein RHIMIDRAFT_245995 [Rhizopus microsporus ATCC 52813]PHZ09803.1 hypothetical protein RHIMIDRAFT_245995 [Rhizopus microsporus ATCC 52813]